MSGEIEFERRDDLAILTLRNEKKKNALDPTMLDALVARLGELPGMGVRAVVLTGGGEWFSSGYDIAALPTCRTDGEPDGRGAGGDHRRATAGDRGAQRPGHRRRLRAGGDLRSARGRTAR